MSMTWTMKGIALIKLSQPNKSIEGIVAYIIAYKLQLVVHQSTCVAAHARLQNLKETDPDFWKELTNIQNQVPSENNPQPEDIIESEGGLVEDDSDMPLGVLIQEPKKKCPKVLQLMIWVQLLQKMRQRVLTAVLMVGLIRSIRSLDVGKGRNVLTASFTTIVFGVMMVTKMATSTEIFTTYIQ